MKNDFSILVIGCNKHEEVAERYFELAKKYWPSSIEKTVFCTDEISDYQRSFSQKIVSESSSCFSDRILAGLKTIKTDYVLLLLDDYFITKKVDQSFLESLINLMDEEKLLYCKLVGMPKCFKRYPKFKGAFFIKSNTHYGISLQPSIWDKGALIDAIKGCGGSSAWQVEAALSLYQKSNFNKCLTFNKNFLNFKNGVLRGKLFPYTNRILKKNNIEPLRIESISRFKYFTFMAKQHLAMHIPSKIRKIGKKVGSKAGKTYFTDD